MLKNKYIQLKNCLIIDCDNKVNPWSKIYPNLGRIHKVLEETKTEVKVKSVWILKEDITEIYGYSPPDAMFVY